jgi:protein O-GlcNAc transferase
MHASEPSFELGGLLGRAVKAHQAGDLAAAEMLYRQALDRDPHDFDALHMLGVVRHQQGRNEDAHALLVLACRINPASAEAATHLGVALSELGRNDEAVAAYDRALAIKPRYAAALNNRGTALRALGRGAGAAMCFDHAIAISPDYADAHYNRASLMLDGGRHDDAVASFDRAIALRPDHFESHRGRAHALDVLGRGEAALTSYEHAMVLRPDDIDARLARGAVLSALGRHQEALADYEMVLRSQPDHIAALNNRGAALQELGRVAEAEASFCRGLEVSPNDARLHGNRGVLLLKSGRFEEALACFDRALAISPHNANVLTNRGNALLGLQRLAEALQTYDRALAIAPDNTEALNNRGAALNEVKLYDDALASFDQALALRPDYGEAWYNRGNALKGMKRIAEAMLSFEKALAAGSPPPQAFSGYASCAAKVCDWTRTAKVAPELESDVASGRSIVSPFTFLGYNSSPALQRLCAQRYAADRFPVLPPPLHAGIRRRHEKLRIAYLSANFNRHAMAYLMAHLFERHDRSCFEIAGISFGADDRSGIRARVVAAFDSFHDVRAMGDRDVARLLRDLEIDIAVDIMGYTLDGRPGILAHRPAPIQVNYLGYPGTMGASFIDYIIADPVVVPLGEEGFYSEKVVRLPHCYQVNDRLRIIAEPGPTRPEAGLPEHAFVFCSFNNNYKITRPLFGIWMRLVSAVPGSVLWLLGGDADVGDNLRREASLRGVDPARLVFAGRTEQPEHLARHRLADLFLDTLPYGAHTTCSDALWAGLPVLTCRGQAFAGRVAASVLHAVGLPELVTSTLDEYAALALRLAREPGLLSGLRRRLAANTLSHPLFDTDLTRVHIETAYSTMWRLWQNGEGPKSFQVEAGEGTETASFAVGR